MRWQCFYKSNPILDERPDLVNVSRSSLNRVVTGAFQRGVFPRKRVSNENKKMNNTPTNTPKGVRPRRGRTMPRLSERLATVRSYPSFGSSALTGVLR